MSYIRKNHPKATRRKNKIVFPTSRSSKERCQKSFWSSSVTICNYTFPNSILGIEILKKIMDACIKLHNMIVKDERDEYDVNFDCSYDGTSDDVSTPEVLNEHHKAFRRYLEKRAHMH